MAETQINRRPVRASFYGLVWGLSLFVLLVWESIILLDSLGGVIVKGIAIVVAAIALSLVWAYFGPARKPKGGPPGGPAWRRGDPPVAPADTGPPPVEQAPVERSPFEATTAVIEGDDEPPDMPGAEDQRPRSDNP